MNDHQSHPAEKRYDKPALTTEKILAQLQGRGLEIEDNEQAAHHLERIGYYRFSAYLLPFEQGVKPDGRRNHTFKTGASFDQVMRLYQFDLTLRHLVMEALEHIEVVVRAQWSNNLSGSKTPPDPHAHLDEDLFTPLDKYRANRKKLEFEVKNSKEPFIKHYRQSYQIPPLPPVWVVTEIMSFGALSRWVESTKSKSTKKKIAEAIGLPANADIVVTVLHALSRIRNTCAHYGRLWDKDLDPNRYRLKAISSLEQQMNIQRGKRGKHPSNRLYNYLLVIANSMNKIAPAKNGHQG